MQRGASSTMRQTGGRGPVPGTPTSRPASSGRVKPVPQAGVGALGSRSPKRSHEDERDEYVTNLKGQIYLLTIENEMLKVSSGEPVAEGESMSAMYAHGANRAAEREKEATVAVDHVAAAASDELADLEAHMRSKYAQVEAKYQQDLADARRAAEALSTQCAAQSSLIAALKQEVSSGNEVIVQQKHLMSSSEATSGAEIRRARDEIAGLQSNVEQLHTDLMTAHKTITNRDTAVADLKSRMAEANASKAAAEAARDATLDSFARMYTALQVVMKHWREERLQRLAGETTVERIRAARDAADARSEAAESDAQMARAAQNEALVARDDAMASARQLRSRLEVVELAVQRAQADAEARADALESFKGTIASAVMRAETAEAAVSAGRSERESANKRAAALERELAHARAEIESLVETSGAAREAQANADHRAHELADHLALAQGRLEAAEHTLEQDATHLAANEAALAGERDGRIAAESEVTRLRDELSRRPPLDVLRALDIDGLMQRNMQAAAAMQSLMAFVNPRGSGGATLTSTVSLTQAPERAHQE